MEALIELIIRLIAGLFENRAVRQPPPGNTPRSTMPPGYPTTPPPPQGRMSPARPTTGRAPVGRAPVGRAGRLPSVPVAFARPILTRLVPEPTPAPPPPMNLARAVPAKPTAASTAIAPQSAATIRKWLSPATLKQQFLLTEILQPPLALRDNERLSRSRN